MTIIVQPPWQQIGRFTDGSPVMAIGVFDNDRIVGRIIDMGDGNFRADFVNRVGDVEALLLPNYYTAVLRVAEEARVRQKRLH